MRPVHPFGPSAPTTPWWKTKNGSLVRRDLGHAHIPCAPAAASATRFGTPVRSTHLTTIGDAAAGLQPAYASNCLSKANIATTIPRICRFCAKSMTEMSARE